MSGLVSRLVAWWLGELSALVPASLRAASAPQVELRLGPERGAVFALRRGGPALLGEVDLTGADAKALRRLTRRAKPRALIRLAPAQAIRPLVDLPAAVAANLTEALAFEMDRHTPFPADLVHFDARILPGPPAAERISVEIEVARKTDVAAALSTARRLGLAPVRVTGAEDGPHPFNLAPPEARPSPSRALPRLVAALALLAALLGGAAGLLWFDRAESRLAAGEARLAALRAGAAAEAAAAEDAAARRDSAGRLDALKLGRPMAVALLDEISARLSDAHWAERIAFEDGEARIDGLSADPAEILRQLEASPLFHQARFTAAILRDPETGLDRYSVAARRRLTGAGE